MFVCGLGVGGSYSLIVKVDNPNSKQLKQSLTHFIESRFNIAPLKLSLLDDNYQALYHEQRRLNQVVGIASVLSVVLILLGVFGLTRFIVKQRQKEIAMRKVLGAGQCSIVNTIAKEFLFLVLCSSVVAMPVSYFVLGNWLAGFNQHIPQSIWTYVTAISAVLVVTWLTVAVQAYKATRVRPSLILRHE